MRLLVWFWSGGGGGSRYAVDLAARLAREHDVALSLRADDPTIERAEMRGVQVLRADVVSTRQRPLAMAVGLPHAASVLAAHVARAGAEKVLLAMNFAAAAPLALTLQKPLVYFAHDPEPHPGDYAQTRQRATQAVLLRCAREVVALSTYGASRIRGRGKPVQVAPLSAVYRPVAAPRAGAQAPLRLLLLGRLLAYKGVDLLAEALTRVRDRDDWRLTIAGAGEGADCALAQLKTFLQVAAPRVGWLSDAEVDELIASHDVLLAPYRSATQSGAVADAMAAAMPVVATPVGALPEQLAGSGWLAADAGAHAFARALETCLNDAPRYAEHSATTLMAARAAYEADSFNWLHTAAARL